MALDDRCRPFQRVAHGSQSSSSSSSPERDPDEDRVSFVSPDDEDDSQSSLGASLLGEMDLDSDSAQLYLQHRLSPISRLPAEILIAVFARLSSASDLQRCMLVSRSWARNCIDLLWYKPSTSTWRNLQKVITTVRKVDGFFAYQDLIKRLNFSTLGDQISDGVLLPFEHCKRVERLTLTSCSRVNDLSLVKLLQGNSSLLALDVSGLETITDKTMDVVAKHCFRLQGLNVTNCKKITDASLVEIAKNCRRVKRLKLNECSQLTDLSVVAFADHCHELLEIDLYKCKNLTDTSVTSLMQEGRHLRELRLANCSRITDDAFLKLPLDQHYENLRILDLTDCNELQDAGIAKIVQAAPRLRNLVLAKCRNLTDRGVFAVTRLGKNLHYIHLGHCTRITDAGVIALVKNCLRIRYIDLACCHNLTDESIQLLANLSKLKRIGLVKCANITDESIIALSRQKSSDRSSPTSGNSLERVHLSYCTMLSIKGIRALLLSCPKLTHLSLTGVQDFLRDDILSFCREPPPEFTEHQREVFCVFSNLGVASLREHLRLRYDPLANATGATAMHHHYLQFAPTGGAMHGSGHNPPPLVMREPPQQLPPPQQQQQYQQQHHHQQQQQQQQQSSPQQHGALPQMRLQPHAAQVAPPIPFHHTQFRMRDPAVVGAVEGGQGEQARTREVWRRDQGPEPPGLTRLTDLQTPLTGRFPEDTETDDGAEQGAIEDLDEDLGDGLD